MNYGLNVCTTFQAKRQMNYKINAKGRNLEVQHTSY